MQYRRVWILLLFCGLGLVGFLGRRERSIHRYAVAAASPRQPSGSDTNHGILEFLPDSTLVAVEFQNLAAR